MWAHQAVKRKENSRRKCQDQVICGILGKRSRYYRNESNKHSIGVKEYEFQKSSTSVE